MTKRMIKAIEKNNNNAVYCVNSAKYYIKGDKISSKIDVKKIATGLYAVNGITMTEQEVIELTK